MEHPLPDSLAEYLEHVKVHLEMTKEVNAAFLKELDYVIDGLQEFVDQL